jgi:hypothetical protein
MKTPEYFNITKYDKEKFEETGVLDCFQNVIIHSLELTKLPFRFGVVHGDFNCSNNFLDSLIGSPTEVKGLFDCSRNQLTSLSHAPIKSLSFDCSYNKIETLAGIQFKTINHFNCGHNLLKSLEGCPKTVCGHFYCGFNQLETLKGAPKTVKGHFYCHKNKLRSLEFFPISVEHYVDCSDNQLENIDGFPKNLYINCNFSNNNLTKFEHLPTKVSRFLIYGNNFDAENWIKIIKKHPNSYTECNLVLDKESRESVIKALKDKVEVLSLIKGDASFLYSLKNKIKYFVLKNFKHLYK